MSQLPQKQPATIKTKTTTPAVTSPSQGGFLSALISRIGSVFQTAIKSVSGSVKGTVAPAMQNLQRGLAQIYQIPQPTKPPITTSVRPEQPISLTKVSGKPFFLPTTLPTAASTPAVSTEPHPLTQLLRPLIRPKTPSQPVFSSPSQSKQTELALSRKTLPLEGTAQATKLTEPLSKSISDVDDTINFRPTPTINLLSEVQKQQTQTSPVPTTTNVPEGASTYVIKDPLGGSTQVFGHIIQPGETLSKIARQYGVSVEELERINRENKKAMKSKDLIIAGEALHIPAKVQQPTTTEQIQRGFTQNLPKTIEDINLQQQRIKEALDQLKKGEPVVGLSPQDLPNFVMSLMGEEIRSLNERLNELQKYREPDFYQNQYQRFVQQSGLESLYQRYFDLNKILEGTREDVMREAAMVGGFVTQSQVEELVAWRQSLIRGEMKALADLIDMRERTIDKMMRYVEMDRNSLRNYLDDVFNVKGKIFDVMEKFTKWGLDYYEETSKRNKEKITTMLNSGALALISLDHLAEYANPYSPLYSGYSFEDLMALRRIAEIAVQKREEEIKKLQEQVNKAKRELELRQRGIQLRERSIRIQEQKLELQKQKQSSGSGSGKSSKSDKLKNLYR